MNRTPHLALVLDQMEIDIPGVEPLTREQRLRLWLNDQGEDTPQVIAALMLLEDEGTREARVGLYLDIEAARSPFESENGWVLLGGEETWWLYEEAERAYVKGLFLASLMCAHAACERALAGCLADFDSHLDPRWQRWGLTPLAEAAGRLQLIAPDLEAKLKDLAERRKVSAHYKPPLHPNSVIRRALSPEPARENRDERTLETQDIDQTYRDEALHLLDAAARSLSRQVANVLREDALFGMRTVIELLGGKHGHPLLGQI